MIRLEVNSEVRNFSPEADSSIQKIIEIIEEQYSLSNREELTVNLNGHHINHSHSTASLSRPLISGDCVQIFLERNPIEEIVKNMEQLIKGIIIKIECRKSDSIEDDKQLEKIISSLGALIKSSAFIRRKLNSDESNHANNLLKNLKTHLLFVMKGIESAHKAKDDFMLEDLLEFELKDNLTQWKILIIPALKEKLLKAI